MLRGCGKVYIGKEVNKNTESAHNEEGVEIKFDIHGVEKVISKKCHWYKKKINVPHGLVAQLWLSLISKINLFKIGDVAQKKHLQRNVFLRIILIWKRSQIL